MIVNRTFWLVACVIAPVPAATDAASARLTLAAAVDAAWSRAVSTRELSGQLRLAEATRAASTSAWPAPPSLQINHRNDRLQDHAGKRETELSVALPLWLPGQQGARVELAEAERLRARAAEQVARLRLAGELREAAWQPKPYRPRRRPARIDNSPRMWRAGCRRAIWRAPICWPPRLNTALHWCSRRRCNSRRQTRERAGRC
jgi:hypothetical protein